MKPWMRIWIRPAICLICLAGNTGCWAQIASRMADRAVITAGDLEPASVDAASNSVNADLPAAPNVVESATRPPSETANRRVADRTYFILNGLDAGMAVFDVEMTQHCIAAHRCREANPVMPSSQIGQLSVNFALLAGSGWYSYLLKKHHSAIWWLPPSAGTIVHSVGVATGFEHY